MTEEQKKIEATEKANELLRGNEMFDALVRNGVNGSIASWLVDLALRVKRLENRDA